MIAPSNRSNHAAASAASLMNVDELPARTASSARAGCAAPRPWGGRSSVVVEGVPWGPPHPAGWERWGL